MQKDIRIMRQLLKQWNDPVQRQRYYDYRMEKHGAPSWRKKAWRDYWLLTHWTQPLYAWLTIGLLWFRVIVLDIGALLLVLSPFALLFGLGLFVGHVLWK